jgi:hypothetical protein
MKLDVFLDSPDKDINIGEPDSAGIIVHLLEKKG